ncbi:hypothetical protein FOL47_009363 [Perkinsus chesapeaki]|uniref:RING-type E3 ubiquitin transferase n=1 Tax=Perkinsus chesapeaki TaxID=330153 RepID=A0A7J6L8N9_PERCH|nr:hypothetical protein FOL47_009363 [Perkinsus chesapeaki]
MYWRDPATTFRDYTDKMPPGQWNLSVSTYDSPPRTNSEASENCDKDGDDSCKNIYYVGRPLFRGQENCKYFTPKCEEESSPHQRTLGHSYYIDQVLSRDSTAAFVQPVTSDVSPPFTPCASGVYCDEDLWEQTEPPSHHYNTSEDDFSDDRSSRELFYLRVETDDFDVWHHQHYYNNEISSQLTSNNPYGYSQYGYDAPAVSSYTVEGPLICSICDEDIVARGRRFGLLENCSHPFCLNCIRRWRDQKGSQDRLNLRLCPLCRVESFLITPSDIYLPDGVEKDEAIRGYKEALSRIPCKFIANGQQCPFGTSCYYLHEDDDTAAAGHQHHDELQERRFLRGADGKVQCHRNPKLSDFLFPGSASSD